MPPLENVFQGLDVGPHALTTSTLLMRFSMALVLGAFLAYRPWRKASAQRAIRSSPRRRTRMC